MQRFNLFSAAAIAAFLIAAFSVTTTECRSSSLRKFNASNLMKTRRLVGGQLTPIEKNPYLCALLTGKTVVCGGSILSQSFILTSAACAEIANRTGRYNYLTGWDKMAVRCGASEQTSLITNLYIHPHFNRIGKNNKWDNDIGILSLATPLRYTAKVRRVTLSLIRAKEDDSVTLFGFGKDETGVLQVYGKAMAATIMDMTKCNTMHSNNTDPSIPQGTRIIYHSMLCAKSPQYIGPCDGDAGGPLVINGRQVGLLSWFVKPCGNPSFPPVYTDVRYHRNWIDQTVQADPARWACWKEKF